MIMLKSNPDWVVLIDSNSLDEWLKYLSAEGWNWDLGATPLETDFKFPCLVCYKYDYEHDLLCGCHTINIENILEFANTIKAEPHKCKYTVVYGISAGHTMICGMDSYTIHDLLDKLTDKEKCNISTITVYEAVENNVNMNKHICTYARSGNLNTWTLYTHYEEEKD